MAEGVWLPWQRNENKPVGRFSADTYYSSDSIYSTGLGCLSAEHSKPLILSLNLL